MAMVSSASGLLAMLNEPHPALKLHTLDNLNSLVHIFWPEISTSVPIMYNEYDQPVCRVCNVTLKSEYLWAAHQASQKHH